MALLEPSQPLWPLSAQDYEAIVKQGRHRTLPPGGTLFSEGEPATHGYIVHSGQLKLFKRNEQGKELIIRYIGTGEWLAAVAVLQNEAYPVSAQAVGETRITGWDRATMLRIVRQYPDLALHLLGAVLRYTKEIQNRYLELCCENVERRIARSVLRLMRHAGRKTPQGICIDMPLGRQNLADYTGTTLYTVSRTLSAWGKKGWIQSGRERLTVTDPHALVMFADNG